MIDVNILKKGDGVLEINEHFLAVKRKNGTVDVYKVLFDGNNDFFVDPIKMATIGFGEGVVGRKLEDGNTTVFTF